MSVSSPCEICQTRDVEHTCDRCGQLVCERHFDEGLGLCTECAAEVGGAPGGEGDGERGRERNRERPDGVDEYRF